MATPVKIHDMRRKGYSLTDLRAEVVTGLSKPANEKYLPSLLLWDAKGQELFADITASPGYYVYRAELDLLSRWNEDIATSVESGTVVIELGAGNCKKTGVLLQALQRQQKTITYFALDVAADPLIENLAQLTRLLGRDSEYISCQGLLGSYEDCLMFLEQEHEQQQLFRNQRLLFLWLGNSITNMSWESSVDILGRLLRLRYYPDSELLVSVDGNQDVESIRLAYDLPGGQIRRFVRNGLTHANRVLGGEENVFDEEDWEYERSWNEEGREIRGYHVAKRDLVVKVDGNVLAIGKGERIHAVSSAKWTVDEMQKLCSAAGVVIKRSWCEPVYNFGECGTPRRSQCV
ncbi:histidine-specific methyltransferase [Aspergillus egyptiacus]|nr:histidine-specific methyltransferase [Aspergillus egyptiacus]